MSEEKTLIELTDEMWRASAAYQEAQNRLNGARSVLHLAMEEIIRRLSMLSKAAVDLANLPKPRK